MKSDYDWVNNNPLAVFHSFSLPSSTEGLTWFALGTDQQKGLEQLGSALQTFFAQTVFSCFFMSFPPQTPGLPIHIILHMDMRYGFLFHAFWVEF